MAHEGPVTDHSPRAPMNMRLGSPSDSTGHRRRSISVGVMLCTRPEADLDSGLNNLH